MAITPKENRVKIFTFVQSAALGASSYTPTILAADPLPSCILIGITVTLAPDAGSLLGLAKFSMAYIFCERRILCVV